MFSSDAPVTYGGGGSLQFLFPFSVLGGVACILLFLFVKLKSDFGFLYRRPDQTAPRGIASLVRRLVAIWRLSDSDVARQCGADACDYLMLQRYTCIAFLLASVPGILLVLPVNLYLGVDSSGEGGGGGGGGGSDGGGGHDPAARFGLDGFARTTAFYLRRDSWLLWMHVVFTYLMCAIAHLLFVKLESFLSLTRIRERDASDAISAFTMMIRGVPRVLSSDPRPLVEYLERLYPGKVYAVCVPENLSLYLEVVRELKRARADLERALTYALHVEDGSDEKYHLVERDGNAAGGSDYDYVLMEDDGGEGMARLLVGEEEEEEGCYYGSDEDEDGGGAYSLEVRSSSAGGRNLRGSFTRDVYGGLEVVGHRARPRRSWWAAKWCWCDASVVDGVIDDGEGVSAGVGLTLRKCCFCSWRQSMRRWRKWWRRKVGYLCGLWGVWDEVRWFQSVVADLEAQVGKFGQGAGVHFQRRREQDFSRRQAGDGVGGGTASRRPGGLERVVAAAPGAVVGAAAARHQYRQAFGASSSSRSQRQTLLPPPQRARRVREVDAQLGSGIAFVVFKDAFTATRAVQDLKWSRRSAPELHTSKWKVERAPAPGGVEWGHVGAGAVGNMIRRTLVNLGVLAVLMFWSSPLAMVMGINSATARLRPDAVEHFHKWLDWARGSTWLSGMMLQVGPNLLIFVAMYVVIPTIIARCARWERHLTVSGEQRAVLVKTVGFFLVNLLILKSLVETTLEGAIAHMSSCYLDPEAGCSGVSKYLKNGWAVTSAANALSFVLAAALLGVSFDLLAPVPFLRRWYSTYRRIWTGGSPSPGPNSARNASPSYYPPDHQPSSSSSPPILSQAAGALSSLSQDGTFADGIPGVLLPLSYPYDVEAHAEDAAAGEAGEAENAELVEGADAGPRRAAATTVAANKPPVRGPETGLDDVLNLVDESRTHCPVVYDGRDTTPGEATASLLAAAVQGTSTAAGGGGGIPMLQASPVPPRAAVFDIPQYHAFNLTVFAMALSYSTLSPLVIPAGATYFGYRYLADKYNLLMKVVVPYSSSVILPEWGMSSYAAWSGSSPLSSSDRRLMSTVLRVMRVCLCGYLLVMALFFVFKGDVSGYQACAVLVLLAVAFAGYGVGSLFDIPLEARGFDGFLAQQLGTVDQLVFGSGVGYDVSVGGLRGSSTR
ncbi:hypothetical protein CBR_g6408 [Chara braunii]|uniref:CSC1/OSCA1-like 7TM region domain-containing protein n=1 Tax=Chara braunii TaxID=69332 RepID=A0A388KJQ4_CHABU|nr:hypothetical protein CBR_g6408 [Chara braunii]|eukprot:GBG70281.1 hypothetical protein CBR_g6408 [Chara braunii]